MNLPGTRAKKFKKKNRNKNNKHQTCVHLINGMMYITYVLGCHVIGIDYRGKSNKTIEGITCQPWSSLTPHRHAFNDAQYYLEDTMEEAGSFCRSPRHPHSTNDYWVWCYTTDPSTRWGYCNMENHCGDYSIFAYLNIKTCV